MHGLPQLGRSRGQWQTGVGVLPKVALRAQFFFKTYYQAVGTYFNNAPETVKYQNTSEVGQ
jgi:hypothetical protein